MIILWITAILVTYLWMDIRLSSMRAKRNGCMSQIETMREMEDRRFEMLHRYEKALLEVYESTEEGDELHDISREALNAHYVTEGASVNND